MNKDCDSCKYQVENTHSGIAWCQLAEVCVHNPFVGYRGKARDLWLSKDAPELVDELARALQAYDSLSIHALEWGKAALARYDRERGHE